MKISRQQLLSYGIGGSTITMGVNRFKSGESQAWAVDASDHILYDSLPTSVKKKLPAPANIQLNTIDLSGVVKIDTLEQWMQQVAGVIRADAHLVTELERSGVQRDKAAQVARLGAWCEWVLKALSKPIKSVGVESRGELYKRVTTIIQLEHNQGLLGKKISNPDSLRHLVEKFRQHGKQILIHGNNGKKNRCKPEEHYAIIFNCWAQQHKPTKHHAYELYCEQVKSLGLEPMKERTARNYLDKVIVEAAAQKVRQHDQTYGDLFSPYIRRKGTKHSFSMLTGDGIQFGESIMVPPSHPWLGGKYTKPVMCQVWAWVWYDDATGAVVGVAFGLSEKFEMIRAALRQAVKFHKRIPLSLQADRLTLANADFKQLLNRSGIQAQSKKAYNPKEMMAERSHKELGAVHKELSDRWINRTNHTINTSRDGRELRGDISEQKTIDQAIKFFVQVVNDYNNEPLDKFGGLCRIKACENSYNPACQQVSDLDRLMLFGLNREVSIRNGLIKVQIQKKQYEYLVLGQAYATGLMAPKMSLLLDEEHPELSMLYTMDGKFVTDLTQLTDANMPSRSAVENTGNEWDALDFQRTNKQAFNEVVENLIETKTSFINELELEANMVKYGQKIRKERQETDWARAYANDVIERYEEETGQLVGVEVVRETRTTAEATPTTAKAKQGMSRLDLLRGK
jgi:hypothetical protein